MSASTIPLALGRTVLSIGAPDPTGCFLSLWEDEGKDRNRELEREHQPLCSAGDDSCLLCSRSRGQTCPWTALTRMVGCVYSCSEVIALGTVVLLRSSSRRVH